MNGLSGKNVLVTGATSGIGQAIAVYFAGQGANVALNYRKSESDLDETVAMIDEGRPDEGRPDEVQTVPVQADVSKEEQVESMIQGAIDGLGGLDFLINNAGIQIAADSHEMSTENFDAVMGVNLRGSFMAARGAIRHFMAEEKPGAIVNISSVHQLIPKPRFLSYSMSKGGMMNLTRTLALEYAANNIRVNGVGPGATITRINSAWTDDPEKTDEVTEHIPMGRAGTAEEMAAVTAFLCSDEAAYITGQTIFVDGGLTLYADFRTAWSSE